MTIEQIIELVRRAKVFALALSGENEHDFQCVKLWESGVISVKFAGCNRSSYWEESYDVLLEDLETIDGNDDEIIKKAQVKAEERLEANRIAEEKRNEEYAKRREAEERKQLARLQEKYDNK